MCAITNGCACFVLACSCDCFGRSCLRIRRIDIDDQLTAAFGIINNLSEAVGEEVEGVVEEVEAEDVAVEQVGTVGDAIVHDVDVALVEHGGPNAVLVR